MPCTQDNLCSREHHWCDGCQRWKHEVQSCGVDDNGDPDAPDLCYACRERIRTGRRVQGQERPRSPLCHVCGCPYLTELGQLGSLMHYRCPSCGMDQSRPAQETP